MVQVDPTRAPDDDKLGELILFIAQRSEGDERFGAVKLNKLLFFSDFLAYCRLGRSITGQAYQKLDHGPCPRKLVPVVGAMQSSGAFAWKDEQDEWTDRTRKVPVALRPPNLNAFSADEIAIVTEVIESFWRNNAKGISTISHGFTGWEHAETNETIPYEVALVQFKKPRKKDIQKALDIGEKLVKLRQECSSPNGGN
jgi:antitoxin SocA-like protein